MRTIHFFSPWLKSLKKYQKVWWQIESALKSENELYDFVPNASDIWVRDFMPFQRHDEEFVIYRYNPDYLQGKTQSILPIAGMPSWNAEAVKYFLLLSVTTQILLSTAGTL